MEVGISKFTTSKMSRNRNATLIALLSVLSILAVWHRRYYWSCSI